MKIDPAIIINCTKNTTNHYPYDYVYLRLPVDNTVSDNHIMFSSFDEITRILKKYDKKGMKVLIVSTVGASRATTVIVAYMMRYKGMSLEKAIKFLISKRFIAFNFGSKKVFIEALKAYEKLLIKRGHNFL